MLVTTEDGYVLNMERIKRSGFPILIMHGLLGSSRDFLAFGDEKSLPLSLAEQGYDVWIGNNRGNTLSRKHQKLDPDKNSSFWNFRYLLNFNPPNKLLINSTKTCKTIYPK